MPIVTNPTTFDKRLTTPFDAVYSIVGKSVGPDPFPDLFPTRIKHRFTTPFDFPYSTAGTPTGGSVPPPAPYQVSIAGRAYLIDTSFEPYRRDAFRHRSIPSQREAIDLTNEPGEGTVNTADLWRRGQDNWVLGAGQPYLDRKGSSPNRFWQSKGIDTTLTWQLTLLQKPVNVYSTSSTRVQVLSVGGTVYVADGTTVKFSTDLATWTTVTGHPTTATAHLYAMATNAHTVWFAYGKKGIYKTTAGTAAMTSYVTGTVKFVGWGAIYLMAASGPKLYQITATGALPATPFYTHPNPSWEWNGLCWGDSEIYLSGYVNAGATKGQTGAIFRCSTVSTTTPTLHVPVQALPFEGGEWPTAIYSYLNYVFIGTNLGIRMARTIAAYDPSGNAGDLEAGAIQPNLFQQVKAPVTGIVGHNRFIYFTWPTFDTTSAGLGRLDLSNFVDDLTPAYVSDMMVTKAPLTGCVWLGVDTTTSVLGKVGYQSPLLGVAGSGIWANTPTAKVSSGYVDSGYATYGIPDDKVATALSLRALAPLAGWMQGLLSADAQLGQDYRGVGATTPTHPARQYPLDQVRGEMFQVRVMLRSDGANGSPTFSRWLLKAYPCVVAGMLISCVLMLSRMTTEQGVNRAFDPYAEYEFLEGLRQSQQIVRYVEGPFAKTVIVTSLDWIPNQEQGNAGNRRGYNSDLVVYLKTLPETSA